MFIFSDEVGATSSDDSSNRIRTATRDGDHAVIAPSLLYPVQVADKTVKVIV